MKKGCLIAFACMSGLVILFLVGAFILALLNPIEADTVANTPENKTPKKEEAEGEAVSLPSKEVQTPPEAPQRQETAISEPITPPVSEPAAPAIEVAENADENKEFTDEAKALFLELKAMRNQPKFHEYGFGAGGPYRKWFESFKDLQERTRGNTDLMIKGIVVGDLYTIGQDWMRNKGRDTEASLTLSQSLNEAFGIEKQVESIFLPRTWTSADGQRTFEGELQEINQGNVTISKDGESVSFSTTKLSREDQIALGQNVSFETKDGSSFRLVSVTMATDNSIVVSDGKNLTTLPFENLPDDMRMRFSKPQSAPVVEPSPPEKKDVGDVHGAWAYMQQFVERELKNPKSAKFPFGGSRQVQDLGGGRYKVNSWVESTNSFGATIRNNFTGTIERIDDGWELKKLSFDSP